MCTSFAVYLYAHARETIHSIFHACFIRKAIRMGVNWIHQICHQIICARATRLASMPKQWHTHTHRPEGLRPLDERKHNQTLLNEKKNAKCVRERREEHKKNNAYGARFGSNNLIFQIVFIGCSGFYALFTSHTRTHTNSFIRILVSIV